MPKLTQRVSIEGLLRDVEASGAALGEKATALSAIIEEIDERLKSMDGKTYVAIEDGAVIVSLERYRDWGLFVRDNECEMIESDDGEMYRVPQTLVSVSVSRKANAFPLVLKLLPAIKEEQLRQVNVVTKAFDSLRLDRMPDTEGQ